MELVISCALMGVENTIEFIVCIDAHGYIDDLKDAIKSECEGLVTCDGIIPASALGEERRRVAELGQRSGGDA